MLFLAGAISYSVLFEEKNSTLPLSEFYTVYVIAVLDLIEENRVRKLAKIQL